MLLTHFQKHGFKSSSFYTQVRLSGYQLAQKKVDNAVAGSAGGTGLIQIKYFYSIAPQADFLGSSGQ